MKNKKQMTVITTKIHKVMMINKLMARKMGINIANVTGTLIQNINNDFFVITPLFLAEKTVTSIL